MKEHGKLVGGYASEDAGHEWGEVGQELRREVGQQVDISIIVVGVVLRTDHCCDCGEVKEREEAR